VNSTNLHLVGHSLGAQIAGYAGKDFIQRTKSQLGRISALEPAGPLFEMAKDYSEQDKLHLTKDDATFVDVIHTTGKEGNAFPFGMTKRVGDADFYPNGGYGKQGGCFYKYISCSHNRSVDYFMKSINSDFCFMTTNSNGSVNTMGYHSTKPAKPEKYEPHVSSGRRKKFEPTDIRCFLLQD